MASTFKPVRAIAPTAPAYREAYPRLNVAAAVRHVQEGASICGFMRRRPIGHVACDVMRLGLIIDYEIIPDGGGLVYARGELGFKIVSGSSSAVAKKLFILCPICKQARQSVFFGRAWACAECHRLLRRSQVIPSGARVHEERCALRRELGRGRPRGMHSSKYTALVEKLAELDRLAAKLPLRIASEEHCRLISEEWVSPDTFQRRKTDPASEWCRSGI